MPAGRRPLLLEDKKSRGTARVEREVKSPAPRVVGIPLPPPWMDEIGKEYWHRVAHILSERRQLSQDDCFALEGLCRTYSEWREAALDMETNGRYQTVTTQSGDEMERARPCVGAFADADRRLRAYLIEFGLTAVSRSRVNIPEGSPPEPPKLGAKRLPQSQPDDPLSEFGLN